MLRDRKILQCRPEPSSLWGHSYLWGPLQFSYRHQTHATLVIPKYVLSKHCQGATKAKTFSDAGNHLYAKLSSSFHFIPSPVLQNRSSCVVLIVLLLHKYLQYNIDTDIFNILNNIEGNNHKLIIDLHRKFQCSVPKKINSHLLACLNMDLRA